MSHLGRLHDDVFMVLLLVGSWYSEGLRVGRVGFYSQQGQEIFLFVRTSKMALGPTKPPIQCIPGALSSGVRLPGREADDSFPSAAEVKMMELLLHFSFPLRGMMLN
jgi:hypothetical protein